MMYQNQYQEYSLNENFWREVLEGQTIKRVLFDEMGVSGLELGNGEVVRTPGDSRRLYVMLDHLDATVASDPMDDALHAAVEKVEQEYQAQIEEDRKSRLFVREE